MSRREFMERLEKLLTGLPEEERKEALQYYSDYFDDAGKEHEEDVIRELISPENVASKIKTETGKPQQTDGMYSASAQDTQKEKRKHNKVIFIILAVLTAIVVVNTLIAGALGVFGNREYVDTGIVKEEESFANVQSIDVELPFTDLVIETAEVEEVEIEYDGMADEIRNRTYAKMEGGELNLTASYKRTWISNRKDEYGQIRIKVPAAKVLDEISINISAGSVKLKDISAGELEFDLEAGELKTEGLDTDLMEISCDTGSVEADVLRADNIEIDCGVGEVNLTLSGSRDDYDYELECSVGQITIDGSSYSGISNRQNITNGAAKKMEIDCSIGDVTIDFK